MTTQTPNPTTWETQNRLGWNRASYMLLSVFLLTLFLLGYVWWPLAEEYLAQIDWQGRWWLQIDWLLIGIFLFMTLTIMTGADIRTDIGIVLVGVFGGLVIESWGTQTELWTYYTFERPPLWIIPAWPIANLTIERMVRFVSQHAPQTFATGYKILYWLIFPIFFVFLLAFVWPTLDKSFTILAIILCALLISTPTDYRLAVITFGVGVSLGYFLELWGTTRLCWTYYTQETPPLFAVLAHGMAAVAFWRVTLLLRRAWQGLFAKSSLAGLPST